jgi:hypothetical protein
VPNAGAKFGGVGRHRPTAEVFVGPGTLNAGLSPARSRIMVSAASFPMPMPASFAGPSGIVARRLLSAAFAASNMAARTIVPPRQVWQ